MNSHAVTRRTALRTLGLAAGFGIPIAIAPGYLRSSTTAQANQRTMSMVRYDADPVAASVDASWRTFPVGAGTVYLVNPTDIHTVVGIAAAYNSELPGPVLYTTADGELPDAARAEVGRLRPQSIIALGGPALIDPTATTSAADAARAAAQTSGTDPQTVKTVTWDEPTPSAMSCRIARELYPSGTERVNLVEANKADTVALAAISGSGKRGPVLIVNADSIELLRETIKELKTEHVTVMGDLSDDLVQPLTDGYRHNRMANAKIHTVALNMASVRKLNKDAPAVVASVDDPASLLLGAQLARGPLVPLAPETTLEQAKQIVASASQLANTQSTRFVAIGPAGSNDQIFSPRPPNTLSGGLTSVNVVGVGLGTYTTVTPPQNLPSGQGREFRYRVAVEDGLPVDGEKFARFVAQVLNDERGWGRNFVQVNDDSAQTTIVLAGASLVDELCAPLDTRGETSCNQGKNTVINVERWTFGATPFTQAGGTLKQYRQYVLNHEVGHAQGYQHVPSPGRGLPAPVMLQQTLDMQGCKPNPWPNP